MSDNFERHRLTRWVKADVPTYGDEWGSEYDEYENEQENFEQHAKAGNMKDDLRSASSSSQITPAIDGPRISASEAEHLVSNSTLVLSIDKSDFAARKADQDSSEEDESFRLLLSQGSKSSRVGRRQPLEETDTSSMVSKAVHEASDFMPPTPTYQTRHYFSPGSPETEASDRSLVSDTDSIQREPDHLNIRSPQGTMAEDSSFTSHVTSASSDVNTSEPPQMPHLNQGAPEALVLSIDRLDLGASDDDSSFDDYNLETEHNLDLTVHDVESQSSKKARAMGVDYDEDDWGYNSEHSSNFDEHNETTDLPDLQLKKTMSNKTHRTRIKTDALDSLIDDLSKMEGDPTLFRGNSSRALHANQPDGPFTGLQEEITEGHKSLLPTLDSIHDMKLPDFENHRFDDTGDVSTEDQALCSEAREALGQDLQTEAANTRKTSIRKPPSTLSIQSENLPPLVPRDSKTRLDDVSNAISEDPTNKSVEEMKMPQPRDFSDRNADIKDPKALDLVPPPISKDSAAVNRRDSTMSTATFNLGAWKPNTSIYRDQFVGDNDNESQMNVNIFNKDDLAYKKFTRLGPVSSYAPSISNSSCVSVPDTVDTSLQRINEDHLDEDFSDAISVAKSYQPVTPYESPDHSLESSVLYDHNYEKPKFHEETHTPVDSVDELSPIREEGECQAVSTGTSGTKIIEQAESNTKVSHPLQVKYPVSNWKKIMAISQPIDRIELLKKARIDEMNYETGLSQWLRESLKSTESPHIQIGKLATQAYKNAQHSDIRRHTSIRSKVNLVRDKIEPGHLGMHASSLGRKFLSRGKKLMKQSSD
ncbi:hypothetical protein METBIDRAFT_75327 [Metschnikowia bicuspidata var. bicuspidata NRRL YB-4993]|uniref:Protein FYV8 n=1 Tax=Metschnikowia bicuspidata var. bicuspidata NRRL YB-4993 TaxID=869754 RepID=A0A1A0H1P1_9ASCO|nr:hypothetical protein METBIDRAFT_75327 [Metschnikowia bicuspidata var. bicuspidata NRRL YB-4993]OBA17946.1 hypothetical protein METBIDRAFT_75327 [Metschnikowia bicuspidata var. bicuspidata NRRL YB-4993]